MCIPSAKAESVGSRRLIHFVLNDAVMLNTQFPRVEHLYRYSPTQIPAGDAGQIIVLSVSGRQLNGWRQQRDVDN